MTRLRRSERGASAVIISVFVCFVLLVSAAFAVDLGLQKATRRDMQAMADVVALDVARELDGRKKSVLVSVAETAKDASVARNEDTLGDAPAVAVELGRLDAQGAFQSIGDNDVPNAVRVTSDTNVGFAFGGITGVEEGNATRSAVAVSEGGACFAIGSYAARLDTGASPLLGPLLGALGSNVTLSAVDYNGLANVDVKLLDLIGVDLGAGTLDELIAGDQLVSLGDFYVAVAEAISKDHAVQATLLKSIAVGVQDVQLRAGDLLNLGTGGAAGLDADLNLFDLVTAAAAAATGQHALEVPQAGVNLGPLANVSVGLTAIEAPTPGCGRKNSPEAVASSSQVDVKLSAALADVSVPGLLETKVKLTGLVEVASAEGRLTDVRCSPRGITVAVSDGLIVVDLTIEVTVSLKVGFIVIPVASGPIRITGSKSLAETPADKELLSDPDYDVPATAGYAKAGLPYLSTNTSGFKLIGLPLGVALAPILDSLTSGLVNPLLSSLDSVVGGLMHTLGADLSGADVYARRTPKCDAVKLVG